MPQVKKVDFRLHDWIDGKYKVERVLGHSRHDSKFKVIDREGNQYMLKLLNLWQVETARQAKDGVKTESEIAGCAIPSNYLTEIVGSGSATGNPYLLTRYYPSADLSGQKRRQDVADIIANVLYGLKDLHENGKVHGNLTDENVLITGDGKILLTNYVTWGNRNQTVMDYRQSGGRLRNLSLAYMAPERFNIEKSATILPTADIYSAGVLAYCLLTGRYPFGMPSNMDAYLNKSGAGEWNRSLLGRENARWENFLDKTLSPIPSQRPQSADEALQLLPDIPAEEYRKAENAREFGMKPRNGLQLRLLQGEEFGRVYRLGELFSSGTRRILTLGRQDNEVFNQIQIKESGTTFVSRRHSTIELDSETGKVYIRDGQWNKESKEGWINSLNGTYVNSREVSDEGMELTPGDIISVGDVKLRVEGY